MIPPQQRIAEHWYQGTADAIYQNVYTIEKAAPRDTLILAGDHIYKMNYAEMIDFHREQRADLTIACLPVPRAAGPRVRRDGRRRRRAGSSSFLEKPDDPPAMPGHPDLALASMGIYVFTTDVMYELLFQDAARKEASRHDFGKDIIPGDARPTRASSPTRSATRTASRPPTGATSARSTPTYQTSMDLIQIDPILNLYDRDWPIHTYQPPYPPPKFVHTDPDRRGAAFNSIVCQGAIVSGGQVYRSILSPGRADQQLRPGRGLDPLRRRRGRPPRPHPPRDHRQGRRRSPPASRSAGTARPTSPAA